MARTYIAAVPTNETIVDIVEFCTHSRIWASDFNRPHTTIIFSKNNPAGALHLPKHQFPIIGENPKLVTFDTKDHGLCLVIKFDSPEIYRIHNELMAQYGFTIDYEFTPHITLSRNIKKPVTDRRIDDLSLQFKKIFVRHRER